MMVHAADPRPCEFGKTLMPEVSQQASTDENVMHCMEVCGGHGTVDRRLQRPGIDVWICSESHQDVRAGGGDLHFVSSCASGRITRVLLAEVCGFGALFQQVAGQLRDLIRANVNSITHVRAVRQLNKQLAAASLEGGFASTLITTYFAPTRSLSVCNAGHPPPAIYRKQSDSWSLLKGLPDDSVAPTDPGLLELREYQQHKTTLEPGDWLVAYSNALTEARDPAGHTIGVDGVLERLRQLGFANSPSLPRDLLNSIRRARSGNLEQSDATVLAFQATERATTWRDALLAPFRLLGPVNDRTQIH